MTRVTIRSIVKTSIVTAFTIAAALIWKDVITEAIGILFPSDQLLYKFIAAVISTIFVIIAIYIILNTEYEAETMLKALRNMNRTKRKKILKEIKKEEIKDIKNEKVKP